MQVAEQLPRSVNRGLVLERRVLIKPVQVVALCVKPVVPTINSIGVEHRDKHEDEVVAKESRPDVVLIENELKETVEDVGAWGLSWVDAGGYHHVLLLDGVELVRTGLRLLRE